MKTAGFGRPLAHSLLAALMVSISPLQGVAQSHDDHGGHSTSERHKPTPQESELVQAVRKVVARGRYVSPAVAERLARWVDPAAEKPPHDTLSAREFQIFRLLASGRSVSRAAEEVCLSVKTVSTYRTRILEKMNLKTNADLTLYAVRNRLIE